MFLELYVIHYAILALCAICAFCWGYGLSEWVNARRLNHLRVIIAIQQDDVAVRPATGNPQPSTIKEDKKTIPSV